MAATAIDPKTSTVLQVPLGRLKAHLQLIGDHNLWDELEKYLKGRGFSTVAMGSGEVAAISGLLKEKHASGQLSPDLKIMPECVCHTPGAGGGPPPKYPQGGGDGGVKEQSIPGHLSALEDKIQQLQASTGDLLANDYHGQLLGIIHRPGWTTPQELQLVHALLDTLQRQLDAISTAHAELLSAADSIGNA